MICKVCSHEFEDYLPFCTNCGEIVKKTSETKAKFTVNISDDSFDAIDKPLKEQTDNDVEEKAQITTQPENDQSCEAEAQPIEADVEEENCAEEEAFDEKEATQDREAETDEEASENQQQTEADSESQQEAQADSGEDNTQQSSDKAIEIARQRAERSRERKNASSKSKAVRTKTKKKATQKETKEEKKARSTIVAIVSSLAVVMIILSAIGLNTDVFEKDSNVKAVGISILTSDEQKILQDKVSKLYTVLCGEEYEQGVTDAESILHKFYVGDDDSVFSYLGAKATRETQENDPAVRFLKKQEEQSADVTNDLTAEDNGEYDYYKVSKKQMSEVFQSIGIKEDLTVNCEHCYIYKDHYYFAPSEEDGSLVEYEAKIKSSKRMQDGGYYVICELKGKKDEIYVTAYKEQAEDGETSWNITSVKNNPVFDSLGNPIVSDNDNDNGNCEYEMKRTVIEAYLEDGKTLFCEYILEYPVFKGETLGEKGINTIFNSAVASYEAQTQDVKTLYNKYKKEGFDTSYLPLQVYWKSQVTYNTDGKIGIKTVISESAKVAVEKQEETTTSYYANTEPEIKSVSLGAKIVEGYTVDVETGDYITRDNFIGKDYNKLQELIYRIYNSYDYSTVLSEDQGYIYDTVPYDKEELGKRFYENAASVLCDDGYMFFMPDEKGTLQEVVIPNDVLSQLVS